MADEGKPIQDPHTVMSYAVFMMLMETLEEVRSRDPGFTSAVAKRWRHLAAGDLAQKLPVSMEIVKDMAKHLDPDGAQQ